MTIFTIIQEPFYFNYCHKLTKCSDQAYDLMMETALIIEQRKYTLDNPKGLFCKIAKNYFLNQKTFAELPEHLTIEDEPKEDSIDLATLETVLSEPNKTSRDFVTKEIFRLYLKLGTEQAVAEHTRIKRATIHSQIQKFKKYVRNTLDNQ